MSRIINLGAALSPEDASVVEKAERLKERVESVKASIASAPSELVGIDSRTTDEFVGAYGYKGRIGTDHFARVEASIHRGQLDAFTAYDPKAAPGEIVKFHLSTSKPSGQRATVAGAFGGIAGTFGKTSSKLQDQAESQPSKVAGYFVVAASKPFEMVSDFMHFIERKVGDPGTKDEIYARFGADGEYEQYVFNADGTLEVNLELAPAAKEGS